MSINIFFSDDVVDRLMALAQANVRAMRWARNFGANSRDIAIVEAAYQAALADVGMSFGLERQDLLTICDKSSPAALAAGGVLEE